MDLGTPWKKLDAPVAEEELAWVDKYWRAANYMSVGQIYLRSNPLMRSDWVDEKTGETRDFGRADVKHRLVGHWGTTPGINFLMGHANRLIHDHGQSVVFFMGPGHGGPAGTSQSLLDGTYREIRPEVQLPRRHPQPLRARDPRLHPRGWRARLHAVPRVRRRAQQPQPARVRRRG